MGSKEFVISDSLIPSCADIVQLNKILDMTDYSWVMLKTGHILNINKLVAKIHKAGKKVMLHLDSLRGVSRDREGLHFLKLIGVDGIITMKSQNIKMIKSEGMLSFMGAFIVDGASLQQTLQNLNSYKPDVLIIMPITIPDLCYQKVQEACEVPIIGGGLGVSREIIDHALSLGFAACAVTDWDLITYYNPGKSADSK